MKIKNLFKKVLATTLAAAAILTATAGFSSKKAEAASVTIFGDENACAYVYEDGSGYIECYKEFTEENPLTEINGVPLKEIITFNDGGYVDEYYNYYFHKDYGDGLTVLSSKHTAYVHGCGPEGFFSGSGYLHFTDEKGTYDYSLWSHDVEWHTFEYESFATMITKISWNS